MPQMMFISAKNILYINSVFLKGEFILLSKFIFLFFLLVLNGIFSAWEMAVSSINQNKLKLSTEEGSVRASLIKEILENHNKVLISFQVYISLITIFLSVYTASGFINIFSLLLTQKYNLSNDLSSIISTTVIILVLSFFIILFGELIPKSIAVKKPYLIFSVFSTPMYFFYSIIKPIVMMFSLITKVVASIFNVSPEILGDDITEEEIKLMIGDPSEGKIDESEAIMIKKVFDFDNKFAGEIATHRKDIVAIDINDSIDNILRIITEEKYSRIPLYEDNIDNIVGILHIKDILKYLTKPSKEINIDFRAIKRTAHFLPYSKKTDELFKEMQKNKVFMVIIVDEYGGTEGLVTMEDLIEEIMGNLFDEYDEEEVLDIEKIDENTFFISGTASLDLVADFFHIDLPIEEYETLSGFLIGQIGHIPSEDDKSEIEFENIIFKLSRVKERRIEKVLVVKKNFM